MSMRKSLVNTLFYFSVGSLILILGYPILTNNETKIIDNNQQPTNQFIIPEINREDSQTTFKTVTKDISYKNYQSSFGPLPASLKNTHIPVHFKLTQDGHLVVTRSIRSLIEYFLSANAEEPINTIVARIKELFDDALPEPARSQAKSVLAQYIEYKQALIHIEQQLADEQSLSGNKGDYLSVLQYRTQAREKYLSQEVYDAFFAKDDLQDNYTAGMLAIQKDHSLTETEKRQQSLALERSLPPEEQAIKKAQHQRESLQQNIKQARATGASDAEIFQMRSQVYDQETAERFALSDQKKEKWDQRFAHYRQQRQQVLMGEGMTDEDKGNEIRALQSDLFNGNEQRRLPTLDRIADNRSN